MLQTKSFHMEDWPDRPRLCHCQLIEDIWFAINGL